MNYPNLVDLTIGGKKYVVHKAIFDEIMRLWTRVEELEMKNERAANFLRGLSSEAHALFEKIWRREDPITGYQGGGNE